MHHLLKVVVGPWTSLHFRSNLPPLIERLGHSSSYFHVLLLASVCYCYCCSTLLLPLHAWLLLPPELSGWPDQSAWATASSTTASSGQGSAPPHPRLAPGWPSKTLRPTWRLHRLMPPPWTSSSGEPPSTPTPQTGSVCHRRARSLLPTALAVVSCWKRPALPLSHPEILVPCFHPWAANPAGLGLANWGPVWIVWFLIFPKFV
jgi:hypothetical protein